MTLIICVFKSLEEENKLSLKKYVKKIHSHWKQNNFIDIFLTKKC